MSTENNPNSVQTTITFSIAGGDLSEGAISIILDEEMNEGRTSFIYGDTAYFLVLMPYQMVLDVTSTDGVIEPQGSGLKEFQADLQFPYTDESSFPYPANSVIGTPLWFGENLGAITPDGNKAFAAKSGLAIGRTDYDVHYQRFSLTLGTREYESYPVLVHVLAEPQVTP